MVNLVTPERGLGDLPDSAVVSSSTGPAAGSPAFDSARFRQVLGHYPTGVVVVTAAPGGVPLGLSIGSFASLSLDPPLVLFCPDRASSTWPRIREAGVFCANVLAADQEEIARAFALRGSDRYQGVGWRPSRSGSPIIHGCLAWVDCDIEETSAGGDHHIVVGRVRDLDVEREGAPLVFFRGGYGRYSV